MYAGEDEVTDITVRYMDEEWKVEFDRVNKPDMLNRLACFDFSEDSFGFVEFVPLNEAKGSCVHIRYIQKGKHKETDLILN